MSDTTPPTTTESIYPLRGSCIGNHEVEGVTYRYIVSYIKESANKPWVADAARKQGFTLATTRPLVGSKLSVPTPGPAADEQIAAAITAHVLAHVNNRPEIKVGYVHIKE